MNNFIKKARPAEKQKKQTHQEQTNTQKSLNKVEGILSSSIQLKEPRNNNPYYLAFFQLEGIDTEIPVVFKLDSSAKPTPPAIPLRTKVLLEGK
jgi:hypothetical protein